MTELVFLPATQLAQMIRERTVSSVEVLEAYLAHIASHNSKLNAICTLNEKFAFQRARQADETLDKSESWGALHGVPLTIKDTFETAGLLTTAGYKPLKNYVPKQDATAVPFVSLLTSVGCLDSSRQIVVSPRLDIFLKCQGCLAVFVKC